MTRCLPTDTPSIHLARVGDDNQRISDHITNRGTPERVVCIGCVGGQQHGTAARDIHP